MYSCAAACIVAAFLGGFIAGFFAGVVALVILARIAGNPSRPKKPEPIRTRFVGVPREQQDIEEVIEFGEDYPAWRSWRQDGKT